MKWFALNWLECPHFAEQFRRAIENPSFAFMPFVAARAKRPKPRKAKAAAAPLCAVQLEMATALVEIVRRLETQRDARLLAEARRTVSKLHQELHHESLQTAVMKPASQKLACVG